MAAVTLPPVSSLRRTSMQCALAMTQHGHHHNHQQLQQSQQGGSVGDVYWRNELHIPVTAAHNDKMVAFDVALPEENGSDERVVTIDAEKHLIVCVAIAN
jgi:hypothetical protein